MPEIELVILDDDDLIIELITRMLEPYDCNVSGFSKPEYCLAYMQNVTPTYLFVDMNMPLMNGLEFISKLKDNEFSDTTKIYLCTGLLPTADIFPEITAMHLEFIDKNNLFDEAWLCNILGLHI